MKSSVVLTNVDEQTSGVFRCEVMGDKPYFETDSKNAAMTVVGEFGQFNLSSHFQVWVGAHQHLEKRERKEKTCPFTVDPLD